MGKWQDIYESVLLDIQNHDGKPGSKFAIGRRLEINETAVSIAIRKLKETERLEILEQGNWRSANIYRVLQPIEIEQEDPDEEEINRLALEGAL